MTPIPSKPFLDTPQRVALGRLFSDLIEADFVVDKGEMDCFERLISRDEFRITTEMLAEAKRMDFAKAVTSLKAASSAGRWQALNALQELSMSDGDCVPNEAIQLFAVEQVLEHGATIYSVPSARVSIANFEAIYVESGPGTNVPPTATSEAIKRDYRAISQEFAMAGFDFVYIPQVSDDFRMIDSEYLYNAVRYMLPTVSMQRAFFICQELCGMNTFHFCHQLLDKKLELPLIDVPPSLLIKINESEIIVPTSADEAEHTTCSNFLLVPLDGTDVLRQVRRLLDHYRSMVTVPIAVRSTQPVRKFIYHGFHRSFFDLIAYGSKHIVCRIVFDFTYPQAKIFLQPRDPADHYVGDPFKLSPHEAAMFYLIARRSTEGDCKGLDWREPEYVPAAERKALLDDFNRAYARFGKGRTLRTYKDRPTTTHIRDKVKALSYVANRALFIPENVREGRRSYYRIRASREFVVFLWPEEKPEDDSKANE